MSEAFVLAKKILALPEGPTYNELVKSARAYLRDLSLEQYEDLKAEALSDRSIESDDADEDFLLKLQLLQKMGFTVVEARAYAKMRLNAPGVRRVIARRALLLKYLGRNSLPEGTTFNKIASLEDKLLAGLTDEQIFHSLGV